MTRDSAPGGWALLPLVLLAACTQGTDESAGERPAAPLFNQIEYHFAGDRGELDGDGRLLLWVATVEGDISGEARWYFFEPNPIPDLAIEDGSIAYYQARWEIHAGGEMILAGHSAGKTVTIGEEDGIWDGTGVVTEAADGFRGYVGRRTYETGAVIFGEGPDDPPWGRGLLTVH